MAYRWDPWRGCHRCSEGCRHCYIHKSDERRGIDTDLIVRAKDFDRPIRKRRDGTYRMPSGLVYVCFSSNFLIEEADGWRDEAWQIMKERSDCTFLFLTKRIERFMECVPADWGDGYENVVVCCTIENQDTADRRLPVFAALPIRHRQIAAQPLLENIDIERHLNGIDALVAGGESDKEGRPLDFAWILSLREQCIRKEVSFTFRQLGTNFIKDGKLYRIRTRDLMSQARKANLDCTPMNVQSSRRQ